MVHHDWSDENFPWSQLSDAIDIIRNITYKYGRFGGQIKEKFGCVRFYVHFFDGTLHSLLYPGHSYVRARRFYYWIDLPILSKFFKYTGVGKLILWWQQKIYNIAYQKAIAKYPHLKDEILCDADYPELIDGGLEVHSKYWEKI